MGTAPRPPGYQVIGSLMDIGTILCSKMALRRVMARWVRYILANIQKRQNVSSSTHIYFAWTDASSFLQTLESCEIVAYASVECRVAIIDLHLCRIRAVISTRVNCGNNHSVTCSVFKYNINVLVFFFFPCFPWHLPFFAMPLEVSLPEGVPPEPWHFSLPMAFPMHYFQIVSCAG